MPTSDTALEGFDSSTFSALGSTRTVFTIGTGPAVIVIHEVPGITPLVAAFGRKIAERNMTAVLPDLLGTPGKPPSGGYIASSMLKACISREFAVFAHGKTSPITAWLRELAKETHARCGGPGVGAIGMCLTGGFALAMMVDDVVVAPVLSQPSLPAAVLKRNRDDLGISAADLATVKRRSDEGVCVLGLRFTGDPMVPAARFERLERELGDNFIGVEIDSSEGNPWGYKAKAHSVLTEDYSDAEGSPTKIALEQVLDFFRERLDLV